MYRNSLMNLRGIIMTKQKNYKNAKEVEKQNKKRKKIAFILKLTALLVIILGTILFMLLSPTFNVRKITVKGNEKIIMYFCKYKLEIKDYGKNNGKKYECFGD